MFEGSAPHSRQRRRLRRWSLVTLTAAVTMLSRPNSVEGQPIFRPDAAIAGSQFSGAYDIGNVIDGSGLPEGFDLDDSHATYVENNHWTTATGAIESNSAWATFFFDSPVALTHFHMWNHMSNGVASNGGYGVTSFDLFLRDVSGANLFSLLDQTAIGTMAYGRVQSYQFGRVTGVSEVHFRIRANVGGQSAGERYTGLAEVAFSDAPAVAVPEPSIAVLVAAGLLALAARGRSRRHRGA